MRDFLDIMELDKLEKEQLIQLCEALYQLLAVRTQAPAPAFTFLPNNPVVPAPNPYGLSYTVGDGPFPGGTVLCSSTNEVKD